MRIHLTSTGFPLFDQATGFSSLYKQSQIRPRPGRQLSNPAHSITAQAMTEFRTQNEHQHPRLSIESTSLKLTTSDSHDRGYRALAGFDSSYESPGSQHIRNEAALEALAPVMTPIAHAHIQPLPAKHIHRSNPHGARSTPRQQVKNGTATEIGESRQRTKRLFASHARYRRLVPCSRAHPEYGGHPSV